ncbi:MAG: glycosyltransferase family 4 protein [Kangiella sp.]|nr:glycosyltransferase family 4 protein [Kangiella sp.]
MNNVLILQRILPHYRTPFLKLLHDKLADSDISLKLVYGNEYPDTVPKTTRTSYPWTRFHANKYIKFSQNHHAVWQGLAKEIFSADLIIIEQANRLLINYLLLLYCKLPFVKTKLAFWGHGQNMQAESIHSLRSRIKRTYSLAVDWWFAYTELSANIIAIQGFPENKITTVNNTIDTNTFSLSLSKLNEKDAITLRHKLGITGNDLCLYCGGLYPDKKIDFLIQASQYIHAENPEFELIIIGSGPDQHIVETAAAKLSWLHYVGPKFGDERAQYFNAAKLFLMPGLVGLAIIDSFIAQTPMITTNIPIHSPEIAYLDNGANGIMSEYDEKKYAASVNRCLKDPETLNNLRTGCYNSAQKYTLDNMVSNFAQGILGCLNNRS